MSKEEKKMNGAMRLFEALSGADRELLEKSEAEVAEKKVVGIWQRREVYGRKIRYGGATLAAAVCVLVMGLAVWQSNEPKFVVRDEACAEAPAAAAQNAAGTVQDAAMQDMTASFKDAELPETSKEEYAYAATEESGGNSTESDSNHNAVTESLKQEKLEGVNGSDEKQKDQQSEVCIDSAVGRDTRVDITEAEARELAVLGDYVPGVLPTGYIWESGLFSAATGQEAESIFLIWTKGMDSIELVIKPVDAEEVQLTEITREETYNVHLYEIPYAQTLPEEYRSIFNDPVFRAEDLNLEVIEKRMKSFEDAGDTNTLRGHFSVLYEEGVLVRFTGRGTATEIWEMFVSIE